MQSITLKDYRCEHCKKLFFKAEIISATIEIKCKSCKNISTLTSDDCLLWNAQVINSKLASACTTCIHAQNCSKNQIIHN